MDLYFYSKQPDMACTSLADLVLLIAALENPATPANAAIISRVTGKVEAFVQSDSGEALNLYWYDDATTPASWVTDAAVGLAVGLGLQSPNTADTYASTTSFSISGNARVGTLALNTTALRDALAVAIQCSRQKSASFTLHLRKTSAAGITETVGMLPVMVLAGLLSSAPTDLSATTYVETPTFLTGAVHPLPAITSLTGGGATALDGIATAANALPTGYTALLSYGRVGQTWQLIAGTDAEDTAAGVVRPDDYNASTNARIWVQL